MTAIDYEAECDNRARVPEHAKIFLRWAREPASMRSRARPCSSIETVPRRFMIRLHANLSPMCL
ncbi:MAG: hypothetical protein ABSC37_19780, partial [Xanthobacteraceae bacterium]